MGGRLLHKQCAMPEAMRKLKDFEDRGSLQEKPTELWNLSHEALVALVNCPRKRT